MHIFRYPCPVSLIFALLLLSASNDPVKASEVLIKDSLQPIPLYNIKIKGYLGDKIDQCITYRIKTQDFQDLVEPFKFRNETRLWQTEFWGKWILSAIAAYDYNHDPELFRMITGAFSSLIVTQTPDGYIGNYAPDARLAHWDIWGMKYTMLGLLAYYDISGNKKALDVSVKLADNLLSLVGPGKINIVKTGNYRGMPSSSVLEPIMLLYNRTGEKRFLDFAQYIVAQWETADGPGLISKAKQRIDVADRFPFPASWWSYENGQKAYEMMSCYEGLLELYRVTGQSDYIESVELAVQNIIDTEINIAGSGTSFECFYHGGKLQTEPAYHTMETCVTLTWIKLCSNLLRLTGNPKYADLIEKSVYNALLASVKYDASAIAKYSPLEGIRHEGEKQCGMNINCCSANGPRAFTLLPGIAFQSSPGAIFINLYCQSSANFMLNRKNKISIEENTDYPVSGKVEITVNPDNPETFTMALRIPAWSTGTSILVNGVQVEGITPGTYNTIHRKWQKGDKVILQLDLRGRMTTLNGYQAIQRGPVLLARDTRFGDGYIDEAAVITGNNSYVELLPADDKPADIWMTFTAPLVLGTDLEGEYREAKQIHFCDFASAGNTWNQNSRYRVWIKKTLNIQQSTYKSY